MVELDKCCPKLDSSEKLQYLEIIDKYEIAGLIDELKSTPQDERSLRSDYLGSGFDKDVFRRGDLAIKITKSDGSDRNIVEQSEPLLAGRGIEKLEQLVAVSEADEVMVTTFMTGTPIPNMTNRDIFCVSKEQLRDLDTTLAQMRALGLHPHNVGGILYDKDEGFSFVDYEFINQSGNRGDLNDTDRFLNYILADHNKFDAIFALDSTIGHKQSFETTGLRAIARAVFIKRFKRLSENKSNI